MSGDVPQGIMQCLDGFNGCGYVLGSDSVPLDIRPYRPATLNISPSIHRLDNAGEPEAIIVDTGELFRQLGDQLGDMRIFKRGADQLFDDQVADAVHIPSTPYEGMADPLS